MTKSPTHGVVTVLLLSGNRSSQTIPIASEIQLCNCNIGNFVWTPNSVATVNSLKAKFPLLVGNARMLPGRVATVPGGVRWAALAFDLAPAAFTGFGQLFNKVPDWLKMGLCLATPG